MTEEREVVIAGGGLVGSALAVALAHRGVPCTVLERSERTPELLRGELVMPAGVAVLDKLGLGPRLREVCVETEGTVLHHPAFSGGECRVDYGLAPAPIDVPEETWRPRGLCGWRRPLYDALRAAAERTSGVEYVSGFEVAHAHRQGDLRVLEARDGRKIAGRLVVAADGQGSLLRRLMGFEPVEDTQRTFVQGFVARAPRYRERHVHVGSCPVGAAFVFPFPEGHIRTTIEFRSEFRRELEGGIARHVEVLREALPGLDLEGLEPVTDLQVQPGRNVVLASVVEDGFALVGDAAGSLDPFTGFGMALGLTDAALLAEVASGRDYSARALRAYERRRAAGIAARRDATEILAYAFLDKAEGFADALAARIGERWQDRQWVLPMVAAQFAGYDAVVEPSPGMKYHFLGLL